MLDIIPSTIAGVFAVTTGKITDSRGSFARLFCDIELKKILGDRSIHQINLSRTAARGAVRGLHFQYAPFGEMKFVRCLRGRVLDVAVDLRAGSPTIMAWHGEELSADNGRMLVIPEGCAHGFQVLEPDSEILYLHTAHYSASSEGGVLFDDPQLGIDWPLPPSDISKRDRSFQRIAADFKGIQL